MEAVAHEQLWNANYLKVWTANFLMSFAFMLINPLLPLFLADTFGADKQMIGITLAGYAIAALLIRPFSGYLIDHTPRKVMLLLSYGLSCCFFLGYMAATTLTVFAFIRTFHGFPFGGTTVSCTTVAIDSLPSSRRAEGIGYYGLSANLGSALGPTVALWIFEYTQSYQSLFATSFAATLFGFILCASVKTTHKPAPREHQLLSLDRFLLLGAIPEAFCVITFGLAYGIVTTYLAIYGREDLGITGGTGLFFMLLALGLILSRLVGSRSLGQGKIVENATMGLVIAAVGYILFAGWTSLWGYYISAIIVGVGQGYAWPAFMNMFLNLTTHDRRGTANATQLVSWDLGLGLGMLLGGIFTQHLGYHSAFWFGAGLYSLMVAFYFVYVRRHFQSNRVR